MSKTISQGQILLVSSGDLRIAANQQGWPAQAAMESDLANAINSFGFSVIRAHEYDPVKKHGFIDSQKKGMEIFREIDIYKPLIVAETVWQFSHHVLAGLISHKGPILTVANWSGQCPGLVGLLNLNGSLTKAGVKYSTLWSEKFDDEFFKCKLQEWLKTGSITHDLSHVREINFDMISNEEKEIAQSFATRFKKDKAIMGVFDEGCMGMFNAIVPDDLLNNVGIFKERLSQATLYAEMLKVSNIDADAVLEWLLLKGMKFNWAQNGDTDLTREQTLEQCKMYIAALRIADEFGCDTIGIQYQLGLKDLTVSSDLAEGLLNNTDRPPVFSLDGKELYANVALPHFNEVDECAGIDALVTYRLWQELGMPGENTLHDLRWGQQHKDQETDEFVWVFLISGAAPPAHFIDGYQGASSDRQPPVYFKMGGGTLKGISKPGNIVWSRIFIMDAALHCDIGVGKVAALPVDETNRRWNETTPQWPIMHGILNGVSRDQMMARHKANHIHVAYTPEEADPHEACRIKALVFSAMGIKVHFCGDVLNGMMTSNA